MIKAHQQGQHMNSELSPDNFTFQVMLMTLEILGEPRVNNLQEGQMLISELVRKGKIAQSILNDIMDRHIAWTGGHDVRFRDRDGLLRMLQNPEVQRQVDVLNTHSFPMSQAQEAFEVGLSKNCGKIYLRPAE